MPSWIRGMSQPGGGSVVVHFGAECDDMFALRDESLLLRTIARLYDNSVGYWWKLVLVERGDERTKEARELRCVENLILLNSLNQFSYDFFSMMW